MLFDLRSGRRKHLVRVIYLGLAILMGGGLILFGVGAGNGNGGILNAFSNSGGSNSAAQKQVTAQVKSAEKAVTAAPSSATAWGNLVEAHYAAATQAGGVDQKTGQFTTFGRQQLTGATTAWQKYLTLQKTADPNVATVAAHAYAGLAQYSQAGDAWQDVVGSEPSSLVGLECLAITSYAAKNTHLAQLAQQKAIALTPKAQQFELTQQFKTFQSQPAEYVDQDCV